MTGLPSGEGIRPAQPSADASLAGAPRLPVGPPQLGVEAGVQRVVKFKTSPDLGQGLVVLQGFDSRINTQKLAAGTLQRYGQFIADPQSVSDAARTVFSKLTSEQRQALDAICFETEEPAAETPPPPANQSENLLASGLAALNAAGAEPVVPAVDIHVSSDVPPLPRASEPALPVPSGPKVTSESQPVPAIIDDIGKLIKLGPEAVAEGLNARSDRLLAVLQERRMALSAELQALQARRAEVTQKQAEHQLQGGPVKVDAKRLASYPQEAQALRDVLSATDADSRRVSRSKAVVELTSEYNQVLTDIEINQKNKREAEAAIAAQKSKMQGRVEGFTVSRGDLCDAGANIAWILRRIETPGMTAAEGRRLLSEAKSLADKVGLFIDVPDDNLTALLKNHVNHLSNIGGKQYPSYQKDTWAKRDAEEHALDLRNKKTAIEGRINSTVAEAKKYAGEAGEAELAKVKASQKEADEQLDLVDAVRNSISDLDFELPTTTIIRGLQNPVVEANTGYLAILQEIGLRPNQVTEEVLKNWRYTNPDQERRTWKAVRSRKKAEETYFRAVSYPDLLLAKIGEPPPENLAPFVTALNAVLRKQEEPAGQTGVNKEAWDQAKKIIGELPPVTTPAPVETPAQADAVQQIRQRLQAERNRTIPVEQDANAVVEAGEIAAVTGFEVGDTIAFQSEMTHWAQIAESRGKLEAALKEVTTLCQLAPDDLARKMALVPENIAKNNAVYQMVKLMTDRKMTTKEMLDKLKEYKKKKGGNAGQYLTGFMLLFQILAPLIEKDESAAGGGGQHTQA